MGTFQLACRVYRIEQTVLRDIRELLLKSPPDKPIHYGYYPLEKDNKLDLSIVIKARYNNSFGTLVTLWVDEVRTFQDREEKEKIVRYYNTYEIQLIEGKQHFQNHLIIFGPKIVDHRIIKAMRNYLKKREDDDPPDPLVLITADLKANMDSIMDQYPNLQHFCIKQIPDDRTRDVIVKGKQLEQTDVYDRFVKDVDTSGNVNFVGITIERGRILYVGSDGSVFSRMSFKGEDKIRVVYELYQRLKKIGAINNTMDEYRGM